MVGGLDETVLLTTNIDPEQGSTKLLRNKKHSNMSLLSDTNSNKGRLEIHQVARDGNVTPELETQLASWCDSQSLDILDERKNSPLHYAARYSNTKMTEVLLQLGASVNIVGSESMTPLHYACRYGRNVTERTMSGRTETEDDLGLQVVQTLLDSGADINQADLYDLRPLHHAAMRGNFKVVELLCKQPTVEIDCPDMQHSTPLHIAGTYGNTEVARALLAAGADCKLLDYQQQNVLHRAAKEGNNEILEIVIEDKTIDELKTMMKQKDDEENSPLLLAVKAGNSSAVRLFMERCDSKGYVNQADEQKACPLHFASRSGDLETVKILVENGADMSRRNLEKETPLHLAAGHAEKTAEGEDEKVDLVQYLVQRGADVGLTDQHGYTAIMKAASQGHVSVVRYLLNQGASLTNVDKNDRSIVHIAASFNRLGVVKELLTDNELAPDLVNTNDQYDNTPLHLACLEGHLEMVQELLVLGADIDNKNEDEQTPFHLAAKCGHTEVLEVMMAQDKSAIFDKDEDDNTGLHLASEAGMSRTVTLLLEQGASVRDKNDKGWTALDCAAHVGAYRCAELLLDEDSPVDPMDRRKTTPLHLASVQGHRRVVELLLDRGADVTLENDEGMNALELAIHHGQRGVAECLLESRQWRTCLSTTSLCSEDLGTDEPVPDTPMRMLIRQYPDLASKVLTKCVTNTDNSLLMDYTFLEDTFSLRQIEEEGGQVKFVPQSPGVTAEPYCRNGRVVRKNHCLMLMKQKELLRHPLCLSLLRHKWKSFGQYVFFFQFFLYCLFLASITSYTLLKLTNDSYPSNGTEESASKNMTWLVHNSPELVITRILVCIFVLFGIVIELFELVRMRLGYFSLSNLIDWGIYILSILFVLDIEMNFNWEGCRGSECWQWPVGSFLMTCTWLNLLTHFSQLPSLGIFIIMFTDILGTMGRFLIVLAVFILAFGLGFHILFINDLAFDKTFWALIKTFVMMIGEFEFEGMFTDLEDNSLNSTASARQATLLPFPNYSMVLFILFVLLMSIVVMNLLVGLAVDDIKQIQENAELKKLSMQVSLVLDLERFLPDLQCCLSRRYLEFYSQTTEVIRPARKSFFFRVGEALGKESIWKRTHEERNDEDGGREGTIDIMVEKQRELRDVVKGLVGQVEQLVEETSDLKQIITTMEKKGGGAGGKAKYQGNRRVDRTQL